MGMQSIRVIEWKNADPATKDQILKRSQVELRSVESTVRSWISAVAERGDAAVADYIRNFDDETFQLKRLRVSDEDREIAYKRVDKTLLSMIKEQVRISKLFHENLVKTLTQQWEMETIPGLKAGFRRIPVDSAGLYVPAGKAPLPTVAQILTVAAKSAGVRRTVVCFPPTDAHDAIIVAACEAGADEIYRVGGIAAIAALAIGTETIKPVQKIAGPGNPYVQAAKLQLVDRVGIDMFSGPSEAAILADDGSNPEFLAADILARCEHGRDSAGLLITTSQTIAEKTVAAIQAQRGNLSRSEYIDIALSRFSAIVVVDSEEEMVALTNLYSPEHLEIQTRDPRKLFGQIRHAGSTFLGRYAPVAVGDYASGTNHCLPTGVAPQFSSPVSPETFMKVLQYQELTRDALEQLKPIVETISDAEGLDAHKRSVQIRFEVA